MKTFDVQNIEIVAPAEEAYKYIADPGNLPQWTHAFASADASSAVMRTPKGEVAIKLTTRCDAGTGSVDWMMKFPDESVGRAYSRVVPTDKDRCVYTFVLLAPPVPLEALEGALAIQSEILAKELKALKALVEGK